MAGGLTYHFSAFKTSFNRGERGICKSRGCCCLFASQLSRHWSNKQQSSWDKKGGELQRPRGPSGWICAVRKRWTEPESCLNNHTSKSVTSTGDMGAVGSRPKADTTRGPGPLCPFAAPVTSMCFCWHGKSFGFLWGLSLLRSVSWLEGLDPCGHKVSPAEGHV